MRKPAKKVTRPRKNPLFGGLFGKKRKASSKDGATITVDDGVIILTGKGSPDLHKELTRILEVNEKDIKIEFAANSKPDKRYVLNRPDVPVSESLSWKDGDSIRPTLEERLRRRGRS